jgi:phospholipid/cholesterol/gamma-HCH transport system substrate-binding protein
MAKINHFKVGIFVIGCTTLGIAILIWIGAAHFFKHTSHYVSFFDESVEGLSPGVEVAYLGVEVGKVSSIGLAPDGKLIRVTMAIRPDFDVQGKAVRLMLQGITGQRYLQIGPAPENIEKISPKVTFPTKLPVIPSRPGQIQSIESSLEKALNKLESTDIGGLISQWEQAGKSANALLAGKDLQETLDNLHAVSSGLRDVLGLLSRKGTPEEWKKSFADLAATVEETRKASDMLAKQLEALPPDTFARLAKQMDSMVETSKKTVDSMNRQVDQSLVLLRQSIFQVNQLLAEMTRLIQSLQAEPGRILKRPQSSEPFGR